MLRPVLAFYLVSPHADVAKLGPGCGATYRTVGPTCPKSCPLFDNGCYAQRGRVYMVQRWHQKRRDELRKARGIGYIRHLVTGGWMKPTKNDRRVVDRDHARAVFEWHLERTQKNTVGWSYTHAPRQMKAAGFGPENQPPGLTILASCHSLEEAAELQKDGWKTARVTEEMDKVKGELYCPYDMNKWKGISNKDTDTNCMTCRKCFEGPTNIVFLKF
jgi:hypothetical protein